MTNRSSKGFYGPSALPFDHELAKTFAPRFRGMYNCRRTHERIARVGDAVHAPRFHRVWRARGACGDDGGRSRPRRKWLDRAHFLDLVAAVNFVPGPNSTELAIHIGQLRAGFAGLLVAGVCFITPAVLIILPIAWAYAT